MSFPGSSELHFKRREILIMSTVDNNLQSLAIQSIMALERIEPDAPITLIIDSQGGSIPARLHITDAIRASKAPVHGLVVGRAYSSAFMILQACVRRSAYPNADLMYHAPDLSGVRIDSQDFLETLEASVLQHRTFIDCISLRSGQTAEEWRRWSREQRVFNGVQAGELGIVDEVVVLKNGC